MNILKCTKCGSIIEVLEGGVTPSCCNTEMEKLIPNTNEGATEKHIPVIEIDSNTATIKVGEVPHPMEENHYISWIYVITNKRNIRYNLNPGMEPTIHFNLESDEEIKEAYAYCNLHSLWLKKI